MKKTIKKLFIGAGLSIGAGLPGWGALIRPLAERIGYQGDDLLKALDDARRALERLGVTPDHVLVDGNWDFVGGARTIVRGDSTSLSIAAASILAIRFA